MYVLFWCKCRTGRAPQSGATNLLEQKPQHQLDRLDEPPTVLSTVGSRLSEPQLSVSGHLDVSSHRHIFGTSGKDIAVTEVLL